MRYGGLGVRSSTCVQSAISAHRRIPGGCATAHRSSDGCTTARPRRRGRVDQRRHRHVHQFVGSVPLEPVVAGGSAAGASAHDEAGDAVTGEQGELVLSAPMPSMPVGSG